MSAGEPGDLATTAIANVSDVFLSGCSAPELVVFHYVDAINNRRFDVLRSEVFAPDAVLEVPGVPPVVGVDAVVDLIESLAAPVTHAMQLVQGNTAVRNGKQARGRAYVSEIGRMADGFDFHFVGVYDDELIDTGRGWMFAHRRFRLMYRNRVPSAGTFYRLSST